MENLINHLQVEKKKNFRVMAKDKSTARPKKMLPHNPHRKGKDKRWNKLMRERKRGEYNG